MYYVCQNTICPSKCITSVKIQFVRQNTIHPSKYNSSVILQYVRKNNYGYVNSDLTWMPKYLTIQFSISRGSIVRRHLGESGGKFMKETQKPLLSEKHQAKRLQWAKKHENFDWKKVIFTDESTFQLFQSNRKVWQFTGRRKVFRTVKHPQKVHVWGCFSSLGFGKLVCFERNLDALFMCSIYERGLIPSACEFFGVDSIDWILQED